MIFIYHQQRGPQRKRSPLGTAQGRQTLTSLLGCSILGIVLSWVLPVLIQKLWPALTADKAQEGGILIAVGISSIVVVVSLLKPRRRVSPLRNQLLKLQEKSDGR